MENKMGENFEKKMHGLLFLEAGVCGRGGCQLMG